MLNQHPWPIRLAILIRWLIGFFIGTLIIAATSPLFVRSYLPLQVDPLRLTWTLKPGQDYRWRSEGYASTFIGPHGMPGQTDLAEPSDPRLKIALWGDSQAEGVGVPDSKKIFRAIQNECETIQPVIVYPFARSGENASVWLSQTELVEETLGIDLHVIFVVDLEDLHSATQTPVRLNPNQNDQNASLATVFPAFIIQAARNLLTQEDGSERRSLRFNIGPISKDNDQIETTSQQSSRSESLDVQPQGASQLNHSAVPAPEINWLAIMGGILGSTHQPVVILYAPRLPEIVDGKVIQQLSDSNQVEAMKQAAQFAGITVLDFHDDFLDSMNAGNWPHGFQNGQIGAGHLNARGYQIIAERFASWLDENQNRARSR